MFESCPTTPRFPPLGLVGRLPAGVWVSYVPADQGRCPTTLDTSGQSTTASKPLTIIGILSFDAEAKRVTNMDESRQYLGRLAYSEFADRYAAAATTKPHNALYERPATMSLLGDVAGLHVLDAGCGPGICSEHLARNGATVHAFDVTPQMVDLARDRCAQLSVEVMVGDLASPLDWLPAQSFDKILCSLAFDYVEDLKPVFREFRRVARRGATLVFSMAHPMRDWMNERTRGDGTYFSTSRFGLYWSGFGEP